MLKSSLYKKFWSDGYIIIPNFLEKKDRDKIFFQLNQLLDISVNNKDLKFKNIDEKYLFLKNNNPKLKSHYYDLTKYCDSLISIASSDKFLKYAKLFLNSKTTFVDTPQIRIDHPDEKKHLPQHQELNQLSKDVITFWIPLVSVNKNNGGLYFRPKSHKLGHVIYKNSNLSAEKAGEGRMEIINKLFNQKDYKKFKSITPSLKPGDAVIFHSFIFHGTHPIRTNKMRWVYTSRYNSIHNAPYLKDEKASLRISYDANYNLIK